MVYEKFVCEECSRSFDNYLDAKECCNSKEITKTIIEDFIHKLTRIEVISDKGKELVKTNIIVRHVLIQDDKRTMKIIIENGSKNAE